MIFHSNTVKILLVISLLLWGFHSVSVFYKQTSDFRELAPKFRYVIDLLFSVSILSKKSDFSEIEIAPKFRYEVYPKRCQSQSDDVKILKHDYECHMFIWLKSFTSHQFSNNNELMEKVRSLEGNFVTHWILEDLIARAIGVDQ